MYTSHRTLNYIFLIVSFVPPSAESTATSEAQVSLDSNASAVLIHCLQLRPLESPRSEETLRTLNNLGGWDPAANPGLNPRSQLAAADDAGCIAAGQQSEVASFLLKTLLAGGDAEGTGEGLGEHVVGFATALMARLGGLYRTEILRPAAQKTCEQLSG